MTEKTETTTVMDVYDPAMCCSTGVCGPDVDDTLADFAHDVKWLKSQGVKVNRFNLGQEPEAFKKNPTVLSRLKQEGSAVLPIILVNGEIVSEGGYPDRSTLVQWSALETGTNGTGPESAASGQANQAIDNEKRDILDAIESTVASGNESALKSMYAKGEQAGLSKDEMARAMQTGLNSRQVLTSTIVRTANDLLGVPANGCAPGSGCC